MRFMSLYKPGTDGDRPPTEEEIAVMGALIEEMMKAGVLIATDGLRSSAFGARVRLDDDGMFTVIDGPFTETKEVVGGYAILEARSKEHAIELVKRFLSVVGAGACEVRQMYQPPAEEHQPGRRESLSVAR